MPALTSGEVVKRAKLSCNELAVCINQTQAGCLLNPANACDRRLAGERCSLNSWPARNGRRKSQLVVVTTGQHVSQRGLGIKKAAGARFMCSGSY